MRIRAGKEIGIYLGEKFRETKSCAENVRWFHSRDEMSDGESHIVALLDYERAKKWMSPVVLGPCAERKLVISTSARIYVTAFPVCFSFCNCSLFLKITLFIF